MAGTKSHSPVDRSHTHTHSHISPAGRKKREENDGRKEQDKVLDGKAVIGNRK